jgi:hypothetical protein
MGFDLKERLIARGKYLNLDVATFRITPTELARMGKRSIRGTDGAWPPPPNKGAAVYIGGFPACERDRIAEKDFSFGLHSAIVRLTSSTHHQLCCQFDRSCWFDVGGNGLPAVGYNHGGMSGGPMLRPIFNEGAWDWRLAGVISEAVSVPDFERVTAVRAHFILPEGRTSA